MSNKLEKIKAVLEKIETDVPRPNYEEGIYSIDICGGNYDDAWEFGRMEGRADLATYLLSILEKDD